MNKRICLFLIVLTLTLSGCNIPLSGNSFLEKEETSQQKSQEERLPSVPQELWNHVLLSERDSGICATLTDNVLITVIFVDDPSSTWSTEDMEAVKANHITIADTISAQAISYGASVNLQFEYQQVDSDLKLTVTDNTPWAENILSQAGLDSIEKASLSLEQDHGVNEAPIILYHNTRGRSFSSVYAHNTHSEYAIIFNSDTDGSVFCHELYHLFGAVDYYFPSEIEQLAKTNYPDSIMLNETEEVITDPLTAYLIGWTNTLSDDALAFLQESAHLTQEYLISEYEKDTYTGHVEDYPLDDCTYTGELLAGLPQGKGKMLWEDGSSYEGDWDYGLMHGNGTYTWPDGDVYKGEHKDGLANGQGTYTWINGDIYTGSWYEGEMHGEGTLTWKAGDRYTGSFYEGEMHGEGTYTWATGDVYTGSYQNGLEHGYGVMKWSNGGIYKGDFVEGYKHGYGTYTYPDGEVYSGYWEYDDYVSP